MKILLLSDIFPPWTGGSGRWFWEIYRRLPAGTVVVGAGEHPDQSAFDAEQRLHVRRLPLRFRRRDVVSRDGLRSYWNAFRSVLALARKARVSRIDCGRCLPEGWIGLMMKIWTGLPYFCFAHGEEVNLERVHEAGGILASRTHRWMTRLVLKNAQTVIANSHNTARLLTQQWNLPASQVRVLHPGVDASYFCPAPPDSSVRAALGWTDRAVVLTVGRLQKRKGHDRMIEALATIKTDLPNALYAIVGDGPERSFLVDLVKSLGLEGHVQFLGEVDDRKMLSCYQQCDLFVLPNRQVGSDIEGFGIVFLEAQACGKPVLGGASGGTAEAMNCPLTGILVSCDLPEPIATEVTRLLGDPATRSEMGRAGRQWVEERFDWPVLATQAKRLLLPNDPKSLRS